MKLFKSFLLSFIFAANLTVAQSNKADQKIEACYTNNQFYKILKFRSQKDQELSAKSLFYKGMSAFILKMDEVALAYFEESLAKENGVSITHYQKGITHVFLKDFESAIAAFNRAIKLDPNEPNYYLVRGDTYLDMNNLDSALVNFIAASKLPNCSPAVFTDIAFVYGELNEYGHSVKAYATALKYFQPNTAEYDGISYNIGYAQQMNRDYRNAKGTFEKYLLKHPNDYSAMAKLIQVNYELNNIEAIKYLKDKLYQAYENKELRGEMRDNYCLDKFYWNDHLVSGYEYFENNHDNSVEVSHVFQVRDKNENLVCELQLELDSLNNNSGKENTYHLCIIKDDLYQKFGKLPFYDDLDYTKLKLAILNILNDEAEPTEELEGYAVWCKHMSKDYHFGYDGSSFSNAIKASSVPFEHSWIKENYPEVNYKSHSLFFHEGKPFDILVYEDENGERLEFYFDISAFFIKDN
ncbi:MAG: tetratricopeptide repeat protein [Bacteroidetes bacterium]|nr:tetratricopeptide repeat protein [Bacteroidota bacterium]